MIRLAQNRIEELAELIALLPPVPEGWVEAAQELAPARVALDDLVALGWRYAEAVLTPRRLQIRQVARALLVHPRYLRYDVVAAIARTIQETP